MQLKKCIVLDLDNTLWGGVAGEDGAEGIVLSHTEGAGFIAFQQALLDLYNRGVLLALNSANNEADAMAVIRTNPNMILKEPHFAAMRLNWNSKADNIRELAEELNIGLDSMVFLDDNPVQRDLVRQNMPEVEVPEMPTTPDDYTKMLLSLPYFPSEASTDEDKMRGNLYVTERLRRASESGYESHDDFLRNLGLSMQVSEETEVALERIAQLTEKTNQFNTNKRPFMPEELAASSADPSHRVFHARVVDRFGDYGITLVALVDTSRGWNIETFLMSCRLMGRGAEDAFLYALGRAAEEDGQDRMTLAFTESERNLPAREFYDRVSVDGVVTTASLTQPDSFTLTYETPE